MTALKLFKAGVFRINPADTQLVAAVKEGVLCSVMSQGMYADESGMMAIINEDNANAALDMATNEMEVLAFMAKEIAGVPASDLVAEKIFATTKSRFGAKAYSDQDGFFVNSKTHLKRTCVNAFFQHEQQTSKPTVFIRTTSARKHSRGAWPRRTWATCTISRSWSL